MPKPFQQLDFLSIPSADARCFIDTLGGRFILSVEAMNVRITAVELSNGPPLLLLADHLEGERRIFVSRVPDPRVALAVLEHRGMLEGLLRQAVEAGDLPEALDLSHETHRLVTLVAGIDLPAGVDAPARTPLTARRMLARHLHALRHGALADPGL